MNRAAVEALNKPLIFSISMKAASKKHFSGKKEIVKQNQTKCILILKPLVTLMLNKILISLHAYYRPNHLYL